ncbi:unnamed protein product [Dovyalis caffra]|uniref:Cyclic nucleotide-binding domain-containing protein n=1 Tax=Dovyalis caffra TaxID=77055 RepID=A0AAV1S2M8_9ROSI|nr:unnamed protein product [Dovyalis caffra]
MTKALSVDREGDPVNEMLFIVRGRLDSYTTNGGRLYFFNSSVIGLGDLCGEELLTWTLDPCSSVTLLYSTRTVIAITEVKAFAFIAEGLKFVASQFCRLNCKNLGRCLGFILTNGGNGLHASFKQHSFDIKERNSHVSLVESSLD